MKSAAFTKYKEIALTMQKDIERLNQEFYDLIEMKFADAQSRPSFLQEQIFTEIRLMMDKWSRQMEEIQNDFSGVLEKDVQNDFITTNPF